MDVDLPTDLPDATRTELLRHEAEYSGGFQRDGRWVELWRVVGAYANFSVLDVADNDELHAILSGLPLYPYMRIQVTPLARHPNRIDVPGPAGATNRNESNEGVKP
jgi:muconolactone D-isomerase